MIQISSTVLLLVSPNDFGFSYRSADMAQTNTHTPSICLNPGRIRLWLQPTLLRDLQELFLIGSRSYFMTPSMAQ